MSNPAIVNMYNAYLFTKKAPPFKIYSGKDFIKSIYPEFYVNEEASLSDSLEEECLDDEENYNLYFSGSDIF